MHKCGALLQCRAPGPAVSALDNRAAVDSQTVQLGELQHSVSVEHRQNLSPEICLTRFEV
jgi:hypothetical protein